MTFIGFVNPTLIIKQLTTNNLQTKTETKQYPYMNLFLDFHNGRPKGLRGIEPKLH